MHGRRTGVRSEGTKGDWNTLWFESRERKLCQWCLSKAVLGLFFLTIFAHFLGCKLGPKIIVGKHSSSKLQMHTLFNFENFYVYICYVVHAYVYKCVYIPVPLPVPAYIKATGQLHISFFIALHMNFWDIGFCWAQISLFWWDFLTSKPKAMPVSMPKVLVLHSHPIMSGSYVGTIHPSIGL